jgi:hypothetical protein
MIRSLAIGLVFLSTFPGASEACSFRSYAESGRIIDTGNLARDMVAAATTVDLVEVQGAMMIDPVAFFAEERAREVADAPPEWVADVGADYDAYEDSYRRWGASTITFRILERLKGPPASSFELTGFYVRRTDDLYRSMSSYDLGEPRVALPTGEDLYMRHLVELKDWGGGGSCAAPLRAVEGVRYLVFRDADGRLLYDGAPQFNAPQREVAPGVYGVTAEPASEGDAWLEAVRVAARQ